MRAKAWLPVLIWMGLIFFLSSQPKLPEIFDLSIPGIGKISWDDKIKHFVAYAIMGWFIWKALGPAKPKWWRILITVAIATLYGLSDEWHQSYVPGRTCDMLDLTSDTLGSLTAALIATRISEKRKKRKA